MEAESAQDSCKSAGSSRFQPSGAERLQSLRAGEGDLLPLLREPLSTAQRQR